MLRRCRRRRPASSLSSGATAPSRNPVRVHVDAPMETSVAAATTTDPLAPRAEAARALFELLRLHGIVAEAHAPSAQPAADAICSASEAPQPVAPRSTRRRTRMPSPTPPSSGATSSTTTCLPGAESLFRAVLVQSWFRRTLTVVGFRRQWNCSMECLRGSHVLGMP